MCIVQLWLGILSQIMPLLRKYKKVKSTAVNNNLLGLLEKTVTIIFLLLALNLRKHLACVASANVTLPALRACVPCVNIYASSLRCVRCLAGNSRVSSILHHNIHMHLLTCSVTDCVTAYSNNSNHKSHATTSLITALITKILLINKQKFIKTWIPLPPFGQYQSPPRRAAASTRVLEYYSSSKLLE